ncbi:MAG: [glutamine synthetase] adenylyltransferase / [glutamine synthetase]-adenylyl-L-tyrosine, partial [Microbacteriaceae bacterium]|nr:[glutamine synthetase] adenylyltransferase / [glutamine synthetase]-adenylyl-L-tyrosine [Microbacteriaceae bacterium]
MPGNQTTLTEIARLGFAQLSATRDTLGELGASADVGRLLPLFAKSADPDQALGSLMELLRQCPQEVGRLLADDGGADRLIRVLGASSAFGEFFRRNPAELES